jgi:hypothetical protein
MAKDVKVMSYNEIVGNKPLGFNKSETPKSLQNFTDQLPTTQVKTKPYKVSRRERALLAEEAKKNFTGQEKIEFEMKSPDEIAKEQADRFSKRAQEEITAASIEANLPKLKEEMLMGFAKIDPVKHPEAVIRARQAINDVEKLLDHRKAFPFSQVKMYVIYLSSMYHNRLDKILVEANKTIRKCQRKIYRGTLSDELFNPVEMSDRPKPQESKKEKEIRSGLQKFTWILATDIVHNATIVSSGTLFHSHSIARLYQFPYSNIRSKILADMVIRLNKMIQVVNGDLILVKNAEEIWND